MRTTFVQSSNKIIVSSTGVTKVSDSIIALGDGNLILNSLIYNPPVEVSSGFDKTGLVIWLDFDNSLVNQHTPGTFNATSRGTSQGYTTDPWGDTNGALDISNSTTSWASVTGAAGFDPAGDWSMVWWSKDSLSGTSGSIYFIWKWDSQHQFYVKRQTGANDRLALAIANDASGSEERVLGAIGDYPGDDGAWHHYAITYKSSTSTAKYYVDGVVKESGEVYTTETGPLHAAGANNSLVLGCDSTSNAAGAMNGGMARFSWWHRLLDSSEVTAVYNSGNDIKYADL